jgi:hypothetical protein
LVFDEFPTIFISGIDSLIATARSNKVATCLGLQDFSQLKKDYGPDESAVIMNIAGNIISGQVVGDTAKQLSERFGKIVQVKESISINRNDTSVSKSGQLDFAVPASKIACLSSGEFVGMVADDPDQKIKLKTFHCEIVNDHESLKREQASFKELPIISAITPGMVGNSSKTKEHFCRFFLFTSLTSRLTYKDRTAPKICCFWGLFARQSILGVCGLFISKVKSLPFNTQYNCGDESLAIPIFAEAICPSNCSIALFW